MRNIEIVEKTDFAGIHIFVHLGKAVVTLNTSKWDITGIDKESNGLHIFKKE